MFGYLLRTFYSFCLNFFFRFWGREYYNKKQVHWYICTIYRLPNLHNNQADSSSNFCQRRTSPLPSSPASHGRKQIHVREERLRVNPPITTYNTYGAPRPPSRSSPGRRNGRLLLLRGRERGLLKLLPLLRRSRRRRRRLLELLLLSCRSVPGLLLLELLPLLRRHRSRAAAPRGGRASLLLLLLPRALRDIVKLLLAAVMVMVSSNAGSG